MKNLFLTLVKIITLLIGIAMLIGGSLLTVALPYMFSSHPPFPSPPFIFLVFIATIFLSALYIWARISPFRQQVKLLILLVSMLFLVGGGLCSISGVNNSSINGSVLFSLGITLCGYILVRWIIQNFNPSTSLEYMNLTNFLQKIQNQQPISFNETMAIIEASYHYQPSEFSNGLGEDKLISPAGTNQGSCKIFAFALIHYLTVEQTLSLFGDYYRVDVLQNPDGTDHQNIRNFMKFGWEGISFQNQPLAKK